MRFKGSRYTTTQRSFSIEQAYKWLMEGSIDINPPYQRGLVWDLERKERLIDSILRGLGIPALFIRELDMGKPVWLEVIDGKQRLSTIVAFMNNEFEYCGEFYQDWKPGERGRFKNTVLPMYWVHDLTDEETLEIYERLNFCGVPHEKHLT